jgi:integrase
MPDMRWLEKRAQGYYAVKAVPRPLWDTMGRRRFVQSLQTRDLRIAQGRRHAALAAFDAQITEASRTSNVAAGTDPAVALGVTWRGVLTSIERGDPGMIGRFRGGPVEGRRQGEEDATPQGIARHIATESFHEALEDLPRDEAELVNAIAHGRATPLRTYLDAWLAEGGARGPLKARTALQYRSDVEGMAAWLAETHHPVTLEAVTKIVAGEYASHFVAEGADRKTAGRKISAVSSYWRWLIKRTGIELNPWTGQSFSKARRPGEERSKRSLTDLEVSRLLGGSPGAELSDLIRIAALSGMRIEEIYRLRVRDCADGWFKVRLAKSHAGNRRLPVHSALTGIVASRATGKAEGAYLIHEAGGEPKAGRERSMPASKRFGRYRKSVGVDETLEGARSSRVDFHSLRRWFVTSARRAGIDQATVAAIVGHEVGNLTDDVYSSGPGDELMVKAVEAVRLPTV